MFDQRRHKYRQEKQLIRMLELELIQTQIESSEGLPERYGRKKWLVSYCERDSSIFLMSYDESETTFGMKFVAVILTCSLRLTIQEILKPQRRDTRVFSPSGIFGEKAPLRLAAQKSRPHAPQSPFRSASAYFIFCKL